MKTNKTLYGVLAFAPLILLIPMMVMMFSMFTEILDHPMRYQNGRMPDSFIGIFLVSMVVGVVGLIGMIMYVIHVTKNKHIPDSSRTMWILVLVLAGTIGMLIYYFTWIRKEDELNSKLPQNQDDWK
jgi:drug/metabolite transporter (DMT)-like permease